MSTALDFRTKLQIAILVVLFIVALLGGPLCEHFVIEDHSCSL